MFEWYVLGRIDVSKLWEAYELITETSENNGKAYCTNKCPGAAEDAEDMESPVFSFTKDRFAKDLKARGCEITDSFNAKEHLKLLTDHSETCKTAIKTTFWAA